MMKKTLFLIGLLPLLVTAQVRIPKDANRFTYYQFEYGEKTDTSIINVVRNGDVITIFTQQPKGDLPPIASPSRSPIPTVATITVSPFRATTWSGV